MFTTVLKIFFSHFFYIFCSRAFENRLSTRTPGTTTLTDRCRGLGNTKLLQRTNAMISNGHIFPVEMEVCLIAGAKVCAVVWTHMKNILDDTAHVKKPIHYNVGCFGWVHTSIWQRASKETGSQEREQVTAACHTETCSPCLFL